MEKTKLPSEAKIQQEIFIWYSNNYCRLSQQNRGIIFAVPNGGTRNKMEAITLKATGLLAGVSDLIVIHKENVLFIEVKTEIGKQSKEQIDFENRIKENGFQYHIVKSLPDFTRIIK